MTATAEEQAAAMVAAVRDDPARRLELAARFYDRRAGRASIRPYRRAEIAFMRWQIGHGPPRMAAATGDDCGLSPLADQDRTRVRRAVAHWCGGQGVVARPGSSGVLGPFAEVARAQDAWVSACV